MSWDIYVKKKKPENNKTANYIYNYVPVIDLIDTKSSPNSPLNQYIFNKIKFTWLYNCHVYILNTNIIGTSVKTCEQV